MSNEKNFTSSDMTALAIVCSLFVLVFSVLIFMMHNDTVYSSAQVNKVKCNEKECRILIERKDDSMVWITAKKPWVNNG